jgi:hypothetical protein
MEPVKATCRQRTTTISSYSYLNYYSLVFSFSARPIYIWMSAKNKSG